MYSNRLVCFSNSANEDYHFLRLQLNVVTLKQAEKDSRVSNIRLKTIDELKPAAGEG